MNLPEIKEAFSMEDVVHYLPAVMHFWNKILVDGRSIFPLSIS